MARGSTISVISIQLQQMLHTINNRLLASLASPQSIGPQKMAHNPLIRDLQNWQQQLELFQKRLRQIDNSLGAREGAVLSVPRTQRFRERQSIGSGRESLEQAEQLAAEVAGRLKQLIHRTLIPGDVEAINKSFDLVDGAVKEMSDLQRWIDKANLSGNLSRHDTATLQSVIGESGPFYQNPAKAQPAGPDWLVILTVLIRVAHIAALKALSSHESER